MRKKRLMAAVLVAVLAAGTTTMPLVTYADQAVMQADGVTVKNTNELRSALAAKNNLIIVDGTIAVNPDAQGTSLTIPGGVTIQGKTPDSGLVCRGHIQLTGDGVVFRKMELHFNSTNALEGVPHREIFLAGHSLTLDDVDTYLPGGAGSDLGGFGGTEKELLPTIYAGGFHGTTVGDNASVTVLNARSNTKLQAIYMSHDAGNDNKVAYSGTATVSMDAKTVVREGIHTDRNQSATVALTAAASYMGATGLAFYGNENTQLQLKNCSIKEAVINHVGSVTIDQDAELFLKEGSLKNVEVKNKGALNLTAFAGGTPVIEGNFTGDASISDPDTSKRGFLILPEDGTVQINGTISGVTWLHTNNKNMPGKIHAGIPYVKASTQSDPSSFVLSEKNVQNGDKLSYKDGNWIGGELDGETMTVSRAKIITAPTKINRNHIRDDEESKIPDTTAVCEIHWFDQRDGKINPEDVYVKGLCADTNVLFVKTAEWKSTDTTVLENGRPELRLGLISDFEMSTQTEAHDFYYLVSYADNIETGEYTMLLLKDAVDVDTVTLAKLKNVPDNLLASHTFTLSDSGETENEGIGEKLAGHSISLLGNIGINFYMELSDELAADADAYMQFTMPDGTKKKIPVSEAVKNTTLQAGKTYYGFQCEAASYEMTQPVHAQMFNGHGNAGQEYSYTVQEYAMELLNKKDSYPQKTVDFTVALLNYGASAQTYFGVAEDNLANRELDEADKQIKDIDITAYQKGKVIHENLGSLEGFNLILKSETTLKLYYKPADGVDVSQLTFQIDGETVKPVQDGDYYVLSKKNIKAQDLAKDYIFTVGDGTNTIKGTYSAMAYAYNVLHAPESTYDERLVTLMKSLCVYWDSARKL